jgi:hypothetical protein
LLGVSEYEKPTPAGASMNSMFATLHKRDKTPNTQRNRMHSC